MFIIIENKHYFRVDWN